MRNCILYPVVKKGYVKVDCKGNPIMRTFTLDATKGGQCEWKYIEVTCCPTNSCGETKITTGHFSNAFA